MFAWEGSQLFEAEGILVSYSLSSLGNLCFKVICVFDLNWMMPKTSIFATTKHGEHST